jgi:hypothetical protein
VQLETSVGPLLTGVQVVLTKGDAVPGSLVQADTGTLVVLVGVQTTRM